MEKMEFRGFGKDDDKEKIENYVKDQERDWEYPIPGELEKTQEDIEFIQFSNSLIEKEIRELGLEPKESLPVGRVHLLGPETSNKMGIDSGQYRSLEKAILLNVDGQNPEEGRLDLFDSILHESIHYYSYNKLIASKPKADIVPARAGYGVNHPDESNHAHFIGFNEAVVDKTVMDIVRKNGSDITEKFHLTEEELDVELERYYDEIKVLDVVIEELAEYYSKNDKEDMIAEEVWKKIKREQFTGNMMHLRDVEHAFGPGGLRMLAALSSEGSTKKGPDYYDQFKNFFTTKDQNERNSIAKKILYERERFQYEKLQK